MYDHRLLAPMWNSGDMILPQGLLANFGSELDSFEDVSSWNVPFGTAINDTVNFRAGLQSIALTSRVGAYGEINRQLAMPFNMAGNPRVRLFFYTADPLTAWSTMRIQFGTASNFSNSIYANIDASRSSFGYVNGWNVIDLHSEMWIKQGSATFDSIFTYLRLTITPQTGQQVTASFDQILGGLVGVPAVMLHFDDAVDNLYPNVFPVLNTVKGRATTFAITNSIGAAGYMTAGQLAELDAAGWCIGNHTDAHLSLSGITAAEVQAHWENAQEVLANLGLNSSKLYGAYPNNEYDWTTLAGTENAGMRLVRDGSQKRRFLTCHFDEKFVSGAYTISNTTTLATAQGYVDDCLTYSRPVCLLLHRILDSPTLTTEWSMVNFINLVNYIKSKHIPFVTMDDYYNLHSNAVTVPL